MGSIDETVFDTLVDSAYAAGSGAIEWSDFMADYGRLFPFCKATISLYDPLNQSTRAFEYVNYDPANIADYANYYAQVNPWTEIVWPEKFGKVNWGHNFIPTEVIKKSEFFNDWLSKEDRAAVAFGLSVARIDNQMAVLANNVSEGHEAAAEGIIPLMERFQPHLERAFELSRRLAGARLATHQSQAALDRMTTAVFVLSRGMKVEQVNEAGRAMARRGNVIQISFGRMAVRDRQAAGEVERWLNGVGLGGGRGPGKFVRARATDGGALALFVSPLATERVGERTLMGRLAAPRFIVFAIDPELEAQAPFELLQAMYGLTPAEARLAIAFGNGTTLRGYSDEASVSYHTVRGQMSSIQRKMDAANQADLVRKLVQLLSKLRH